MAVKAIENTVDVLDGWVRNKIKGDIDPERFYLFALNCFFRTSLAALLIARFFSFAFLFPIVSLLFIKNKNINL